MGPTFSLFSLYLQWFPRYGQFLKLPYIWAWNLASRQSSSSYTIIPSFYPKGAKSSLFSLYRQWFPRYGLILKIAIFRHETCPLTKVPEVAHMPSFYPMGVKLSLFRSMGSSFRDMGRFSQLSYLGMKLGHWPKFQKLHIYLFLPQRVKIELILALRAAVSEIWADFLNCYIWA